MSKSFEIPAAEKTPKITRLIVEKEKIPAANVDGDEIRVRALSIGRNTENDYHYYSLSNVSRTERLEVFMRVEDSLRRIQLPEPMLQRIAHYLRDRAQNQKDLDCGDFIYYVNQIPFEGGIVTPRHWHVYSSADEQNLHPGDTILITARAITDKIERDDFKHFAIYLDDGLYLSKAGKGEDLIVTDLATMKRLYEGTRVTLLIPE